MKSFIISICILGIVGMAIGVAVLGGTTATVDTKVTAVNLAISRTDSVGDIQHGSVSLSATTSTNPGSAGELTTTFQNDGSQALFEVDTANSTNWTADTSVSEDHFVHSFTTSTTEVAWVSMGAAGSYTTASSTVDYNETVDFYWQLQMPSSDTSGYVEQTITATVQASSP